MHDRLWRRWWCNLVTDTSRGPVSPTRWADGMEDAFRQMKTRAVFWEELFGKIPTYTGGLCTDTVRETRTFREKGSITVSTVTTSRRLFLISKGPQEKESSSSLGKLVRTWSHLGAPALPFPDYLPECPAVNSDIPGSSNMTFTSCCTWTSWQGQRQSHLFSTPRYQKKTTKTWSSTELPWQVG